MDLGGIGGKMAMGQDIPLPDQSNQFSVQMDLNPIEEAMRPVMDDLEAKN